MQDTMKHINSKGVEYPLVFNLNVMEKIQEKYGSYEKWGDLTDGKNGEINIGALKFGILEMINEGIDIENESKEVKREFATDKQIGRIVTEIGMEALAEKMKETVIDSTKSDEEIKNA